MNKLKVAIIGVGHLGSRHLAKYKELEHLVEIIGIYDHDKALLNQLAHDYDVAPFTSSENLIDKVDAINICVPTEYHFDYAKQFLDAGIHTFIEKPITTTIDQADQLIALAKQKNAIIQVGHVERFNSAFESIKHFTKEPLFIECHRLNHFPNRSLDIGVVLDLMIHDIDIILGINKCPITEISAVGVNVLTPLEDIASVRLTFENGCVCNLTASRVSEDVMRKIRIFQQNTYISLDYVKQEAFIYQRQEKQIVKHALPIEKEEPLKKELEHFVECVQKQESPIVSGSEGRDALHVAQQISEQIWKRAQRKL